MSKIFLLATLAAGSALLGGCVIYANQPPLAVQYVLTPEQTRQLQQLPLKSGDDATARFSHDGKFIHVCVTGTVVGQTVANTCFSAPVPSAPLNF
jgi:hypothetical protein